MKNCSPTGKLIDKALKNADLKASPPHQRFSKGVVRSTNNFLTASSDMKIFQ